MAKTLFFALLLLALAGLRQPLLAAGTGAGKSSSTDLKSSSSLKTPSDAQIEQAIRARLAKSKMNADHFTVTVVKGVATIEGSTGVTQHKGAMTRMAKACGATLVRNNIHISDEAKAKLAQSLGKSRTIAASSSTGGRSSGASGSVGSTGSESPAIPHATVIRANNSIK